MADKYFRQDTAATHGASAREGVVVSAGAGDAGKLVALSPFGRVDQSVLPYYADVQASENIGTGDWANIYDLGGNLRVRRAIASIWTGAASQYKPANGFVTTAILSGNVGRVWLFGTNGVAALEGGVFVAADRGKPVYLSYNVPGASLLVPPVSHTNGLTHRATSMIQFLGYITEVVGGSASIIFRPQGLAEKHSVYRAGPYAGNDANYTYVTLNYDAVVSGEYFVFAYVELYQNITPIPPGYANFEIQQNGATLTQTHATPAGNSVYHGHAMSVVTNLTAGTAYTFRLQEVNSVPGAAFALRTGWLWIQRVA